MITASNLRAEMARQRRKQSELATVLGLSQAAVSRRLSGETALDVDELVAVAKWLGVRLVDLLGQPSDNASSGVRLSRRSTDQEGAHVDIGGYMGENGLPTSAPALFDRAA